MERWMTRAWDTLEFSQILLGYIPHAYSRGSFRKYVMDQRDAVMASLSRGLTPLLWWTSQAMCHWRLCPKHCWGRKSDPFQDLCVPTQPWYTWLSSMSLAPVGLYIKIQWHLIAFFPVLVLSPTFRGTVSLFTVVVTSGNAFNWSMSWELNHFAKTQYQIEPY